VGGSGSMARFLTHITGALKSHGCQVIVLGARELDDARQNNAALRMLSRLHIPWLVIYWVFVFDAWRAAGYPVIVVTSQEYVLPFGFSKQIPIYHDLIQYFYPRNRKSRLFYRYYLPWVSRKLGFVYSVTSATGRMINQVFGKVPYHICGVPIDKEFLSSAGQAAAGEPFLAVWVGTLAVHKNYQRVLNYLKDDVVGTGTVAMVVPPDAVPDLRRAVDRLGLGKRVRVFSSLSDDELSSIYRRSETVISTSELEGFCMPVLEAALCGCRPVVPDRAAFRENFGRFGVLVPPHDVAYAIYIKNAKARFDRTEIMEDAQAFHRIVRDRWSASMDEIAGAAILGGKGEITRECGHVI
jgi:glycosyltransferase involved in cell wall biosynthesis